MELITILLSVLLGAVSPAGLVVDSLAEDAIRDRLEFAEELEVRVDNTPSYQLLSGRVDRVRIAGRGLFPRQGIRIDVLEVETDPIDLNLAALNNGNGSAPALDQPLQAGVRLVLTEADINQALQSPLVQQRLQDVSIGALGASAEGLRRYAFTQPFVDFLESDRIQFQVTLQEAGSDEQLLIIAESGIAIDGGRQLQLVDPAVTVNGSPIPPQFINLLVSGIGQRLDLSRLESSGVLARILQLELNPDELALAGFVRVEPGSASLSGN
ncbi:DUF2993 domain-containing protein [Oculatella sp. LEGE 06141]|uniref:LmeA family phospholipid-binding protein n=1 Tax=Oculatella sp. LEGE 06141 TaxID=1828648 RepID=UPI0018810A34|nr:DUF2993 domain-containing protein [Oculatella sp. LEGE 06141]MBE9178374.1 DUF2993 domain-containing protein [Oculatella sp. LEGE 06141]